MIDLNNLYKDGFFKIQNAPFEIEDYLLYSCISGSHAYGTATENSDVDTRGLFYLPESYTFGLLNCQNISSNKEDIMYYSIKKFFELAIKNNVNILELLFMHKEMVQFCHPLFNEFVLKNKYKFLSKRIGYTFGSYAYQQVNLALTKKAHGTGRIQLVEKYGIDVKAIAHCVRLYRMGKEVLLTGNLQVHRPDAPFLLDIRNGKYSLGELLTEGKDEKGRMTIVGGIIGEESKLFNEALAVSKLPEEPNFNELNDILVKFQKELYKERVNV